MMLVTRITHERANVTTWYVARDPRYLRRLLADQGLDLTGIADTAQVTPAWISRVFAGAKCREALARIIVRELTGVPDAQEVTALFQRTTRMPVKSSARRLPSPRKPEQDGVNA